MAFQGHLFAAIIIFQLIVGSDRVPRFVLLPVWVLQQVYRVYSLCLITNARNQQGYIYRGLHSNAEVLPAMPALCKYVVYINIDAAVSSANMVSKIIDDA